MEIRKNKILRNGNDEVRGIIKDVWGVFDFRKEGQQEISESKKIYFLKGFE